MEQPRRKREPPAPHRGRTNAIKQTTPTVGGVVGAHTTLQTPAPMFKDAFGSAKIGKCQTNFLSISRFLLSLFLSLFRAIAYPIYMPNCCCSCCFKVVYNFLLFFLFFFFFLVLFCWLLLCCIFWFLVRVFSQKANWAITRYNQNTNRQQNRLSLICSTHAHAHSQTHTHKHTHIRHATHTYVRQPAS